MCLISEGYGISRLMITVGIKWLWDYWQCLTNASNSMWTMARDLNKVTQKLVFNGYGLKSRSWLHEFGRWVSILGGLMRK